MVLVFRVWGDRSRELLERDFTEEKIYDGPMQCNKDKDSGPNGFNMGFIYKF